MKSHIFYVILSCFIFLMSCADEKKSDKKNSAPKPPPAATTKKETPKRTQNTVDVPVMLDNKGIGPITSLSFNDDIDQEMANRGEQLFKSKCMACHKAKQQFIGPEMAGIYKKRSPEWVMNMIMNPDEMLKKDPVASALLKAYNNTIMINQNIPEEEARAMVEWFRTLE